MEVRACSWPGTDAEMIKYHDTEWGVPQHEDRILFEYLILDMFQAGLSWRTILHKREGFEAAFAQFDWRAVAHYDDSDVERLMADAGIIRNQLKIRAAILNAQKFEDIRAECGTFGAYCWRFVHGKPIVHAYKQEHEIPASTKESDALSADLKARGFKFVGTTIVYAFMQGAGLVNDHLVSCPRYHEVAG
jgi:DNA-3-methyladenine glycosylase I